MPFGSFLHDCVRTVAQLGYIRKATAELETLRQRQSVCATWRAVGQWAYVGPHPKQTTPSSSDGRTGAQTLNRERPSLRQVVCRCRMGGDCREALGTGPLHLAAAHPDRRDSLEAVPLIEIEVSRTFALGGVLPIDTPHGI